MTANDPEEVRELQRLKRSFTMLADNEQSLFSNHDHSGAQWDGEVTRESMGRDHLVGLVSERY